MATQKTPKPWGFSFSHLLDKVLCLHIMRIPLIGGEKIRIMNSVFLVTVKPTNT